MLRLSYGLPDRLRAADHPRALTLVSASSCWERLPSSL